MCHCPGSGACPESNAAAANTIHDSNSGVIYQPAAAPAPAAAAAFASAAAKSATTK